MQFHQDSPKIEIYLDRAVKYVSLYLLKLQLPPFSRTSAYFWKHPPAYSYYFTIAYNYGGEQDLPIAVLTQDGMLRFLIPTDPFILNLETMKGVQEFQLWVDEKESR